MKFVLKLRAVLCCLVLGSGSLVFATEAEDNRVITLGLGAAFNCERYNGWRKGRGGTTDENMNKYARIFAEHGFTMSWDGSPYSHVLDALENEKYSEFFNIYTDILHRNGLGSTLCLMPQNLLPPRGKKDADGNYDLLKWRGRRLDPETGALVFGKSPRWNYGDPEALKLFRQRCEEFCRKLVSCEMFCVDEVILAAPGKNGHMEKMSGYWTSPTYTLEALQSFRSYLRSVRYSRAAEAKFPVTTVAKKPSKKANMGLPAIPITEDNKHLLQAGNRWPKSRLWRAWYEWRKNVLTSWIAAEMEIADSVFSANPNWQGCMFSAPHFWFDPALALDADKIASIPQLRYLVKGYWSRTQFARIRKTARRHGKKWGGMVETAHYGVEKGLPPVDIVADFKCQVKNGASIMLLYPLSSFRKDRPASNETYKKTGTCYMPEQVATWDECVEWLKKDRGLKWLDFSTKEKVVAKD